MRSSELQPQRKYAGRDAQVRHIIRIDGRENGSRLARVIYSEKVRVEQFTAYAFRNLSLFAFARWATRELTSSTAAAGDTRGTRCRRR